MSPRESTNPAALDKKVENLSDQLETATESAEATTKEVKIASRTTKSITREVRLRPQPDHSKAKAKRKRSKGRYTADGKSKAAVELGRQGGIATGKTLTRKQRSALAVKAAKTRWRSR